MSTPKQTLQRQIQRSRLLSSDRKERLLQQLDTLSPEQQQRLYEIVSGEENFFVSLTDRAVTSALQQGNGGLLKKLDVFFFHADKKLHRADEGIERTNENKQLEHMFDDPNL